MESKENTAAYEITVDALQAGHRPPFLDGRDIAAPRVDRALEGRAVRTLSEFKALPREARRRMTELCGFDNEVERTESDVVKRTIEVAVALGADEAVSRAFTGWMVSHMEIVLEGWRSNVEVELFVLPDGNIAGGAIDLRCGDESAHGHFDHDGRPFFADRAFSWSA